MATDPSIAEAVLAREDVARFLDAADVRFSPNVEFTGKSGFVHKFDFVIPKSRKKPERLLRAINNPSRDATTSVLFAWTDTRDVRSPNSSFYVFLNDSEREPNLDLLAAMRGYHVTPILWSARDEFAAELVA